MKTVLTFLALWGLVTSAPGLSSSAKADTALIEDTIDICDRKLIAAAVLAETNSTDCHKVSKSSFENIDKLIIRGGHHDYEVAEHEFEGLKSLHSLGIQESNMKKLKSNTFAPLKNLEGLGFYESKIEDMEVGTFDGLTALERLDISSLAGLKLDLDPFREMFNLKSLTIANCIADCQRLPGGLFKNLSNLEELSIDQFSGLVLISEDSFKGLLNLKNLTLASYQSEPLIGDEFKDLKKLEMMNLFLPNTKTLSENLFQGLTSLKNLILQIDALDSIEAGTFSNLGSLQKIVIFTNSITEVKSGAFNNLPELVNLELANSNIEKLAPNSITNLTKLENLSVALKAGNNNFIDIDASSFSNLPSLKSLGIHSEGKYRVATTERLHGIFNFPNLQRLYLVFSYLNSNDIESNAFKNIPKAFICVHKSPLEILENDQQNRISFENRVQSHNIIYSKKDPNSKEYCPWYVNE